MLVGRLAAWQLQGLPGHPPACSRPARRAGRPTGRASIGLSIVCSLANAYSVHFEAIDVNLVRQHRVGSMKIALDAKDSEMRTLNSYTESIVNERCTSQLRESNCQAPDVHSDLC